MDFKDYLNKLNELDYLEAKTKLETFYTLNSTTFKFFKAIDNAILELLALPNIDGIAIMQLEIILPELIKLRNVILDIGSETFAKGYKPEIEKSVDYIKGLMAINEVENTAQHFFQLLEDNKKVLAEEEKQSIETYPVQEVSEKVEMSDSDIGALIFIAICVIIFVICIVAAFN